MGKYNKVFETLVGNEINKEDAQIIGMIAYALYKLDKVGYITNYQKENAGKSPTKENIKSYCDSLCTGHHLDRYRTAAHNALEKFLNKQFQESIRKAEAECKAKSINELNGILENKIPEYQDALKKTLDEKKPSFWNGVWQNLIAALIYIIITIFLIIGWTVTNWHSITISSQGISIQKIAHPDESTKSQQI